MCEDDDKRFNENFPNQYCISVAVHLKRVTFHPRHTPGMQWTVALLSDTCPDVCMRVTSVCLTFLSLNDDQICLIKANCAKR